MSFLDARLKDLLKNVFGSAAARFVNLFITLAMVPLTINALSPADYAYFAMALSLSVLATYADLGMGLAVVNVIAARGARPKSIKARRAVSIVWFSLLGFTVVGMGLVLVIAWFVNFSLETNSTYQYNAMLLAVGCIFAGLPTGLVQRVLFAEQKNIHANAWSTGARLVSLILVWVITSSGVANLFILVFAVIGIPVIIAWLSVFVVFVLPGSCDLRPSISLFSTRLIRPYMVLGVSFLLLQMAPFFETGVDNLIVGGLIDIKVLPAYDTYSKLFNYAPAIISIASFPLWPAITNAKASGDKEWILKMQRVGCAVSLIVAIFVAASLVAFSEKMVLIWTGQNLTLEASVIWGLGVLCVFSSFGIFQSMLLNGLSEIKGQINIFLIYTPVLLLLKMLAAYFCGISAMIWVMNICYFWRIYMANALILQSRKIEL